jgi:anti-sigma B factor antagonist
MTDTRDGDDPVITATVRRAAADVVCVDVAGEVDLATTAVFSATLRQAADLRPARLEVDLTGVTYMGCAGVEALVIAQLAVPALVAVTAPSAVRQLLALAGVAAGRLPALVSPAIRPPRQILSPETHAGCVRPCRRCDIG